MTKTTAPTRTAADSELKRQAEAAAQRRANGGKPVALYRNADGYTWTGRGLKPRWLVEAIEAGPRQAVRLTDVQISDARALALNTAPDSVSMGRVAGLDNRQLRELARAIESTVLAANGMGDSNEN